MDAERFPLRSLFITHAREEHRDFELLERNYESVGGDVADIRGAREERRQRGAVGLDVSPREPGEPVRSPGRDVHHRGAGRAAGGALGRADQGAARPRRRPGLVPALSRRQRRPAPRQAGTGARRGRPRRPDGRPHRQDREGDRAALPACSSRSWAMSELALSALALARVRRLLPRRRAGDLHRLSPRALASFGGAVEMASSACW